MKSVFLFLGILCASIGFGQTIVSVTPANGMAGDTVSITIVGSGTNFGSSTNFLFTKGTDLLQVENMAVQSTTSATCDIIIPASATSGFYMLTAVAGLAIPVIKQNAFEVTGGQPAAAIQNIDPNVAQQGQSIGVTVVCSGTTFTEALTIAASLVTTTGNPIVSDVASAIDDSTLFCFFTIPQDAELGNYSFVVVSDNVNMLTKANGFTIVEAVDPGALVSITPHEAPKDTTITVLIEGEGTGFLSMTNLSIMLYSDFAFLEATNVNVLSDTQLEATFEINGASRTGSYSLVLSSDITFLFLEDAFTITGDPATEPAIVSISPASGFPGQTINMTVLGTNTHFTEDELEISTAIYNQDTFVEASSWNVVNDSVIQIVFDLPVGLPLGIYDFGLVTMTDGFLSVSQAFFVNAVGLDEQIKRLTKVYPNPVKDGLTFETNRDVRKVTLVNLEGKLIELTDVSKNGHIYQVALNRDTIKAGIYFLKVETADGVLFHKLSVE